MKFDQFLESSTYIDWRQPEVLAKAALLEKDCGNQLEVAQACFKYVLDHIKHSGDYQLNPITCKASDVLQQQTGYCFAKSHLLAALLRANGIPAGLCYQRLTINNDKPPFCLHGLNAVYLDDYGWYRVDARGNKAGVTAAFCPPKEQLAFGIISNGEADLPEIWASPRPEVITLLEENHSYRQVAENLPDVELIDSTHLKRC